MPGKLVELMSRVRATVQTEVSRGYEKAAAGTRRVSGAVRRAVRRTEDADHSGGRMLGAGSSGVRPTGSFDAVTEIHRPPFNRRYANTHRIEYRRSELPVFAGPVVREQVQQGEIGNCSVVAVLSAIAKRRPEAIERAIRDRGDGTFDITFHEIDPSAFRKSARPTGETTTFRVSDELPYRRDGPPGPPIGVRSDTCSWPSLLEKTIAGEDRAWDAAMHSDWNQRWQMKKPGIDSMRAQKGLLPAPSTPPLGYNRLGAGASPFDQANLLAKITGEEAEIKELTGGHADLLAQFKSQIDNNKPVLVSTSPTVEGAVYPDGIYANHAYEVDRVIGNEIELRNPWGYDHPEPMSAGTLLRFFNQHFITLS